MNSGSHLEMGPTRIERLGRSHLQVGPKTRHMAPDPAQDYVFSALDAARPIAVYRRHLPHWRQEGALYFTTFRLADSIPSEVLNLWAFERRAWLVAHGLAGNLPEAEWLARYLAVPEGVRRAFERDEARRYLIELDRCHGECRLRDPECAAVVHDALRFFHGQRLYCGDFAIMPNHVHWIVAPMPGYHLEDLLQSVKSFSSRRINERLRRRGGLWQKESFDHIIRDQTQLERIRSYIKQNPSKAHLNPGEFIYHQSEWLK